MECKQERRFGATFPRTSQAAPDLSFGMSGLVGSHFSTNDKPSISSLVLPKHMVHQYSQV
jgi:hypothetical protein